MAPEIFYESGNSPAVRLSQFFTEETRKKSGFAHCFSCAPSLDPLVTSIEYDSRNVKQGSLFFALPGLHTDGSVYIKDAINRGASVIVHENEISDNDKIEDIVYLKTDNARFAMSPISASYYGFPSQRLLVTGVTGTEGKSTTVYLIWQLLTMMGRKAGFISTVQHCMGKDVMWNPEHQTTPEAPVVQRLLRAMADNGCEYAVLEASSHGLSRRTNRLGDVNFYAGVLTNVTHEHLEFHGTWEQYRDDKANLFRALDNYAGNFVGGAAPQNEPFGVVNADDKSAHYFCAVTGRKILSYSPAGKEGDIILEAIESASDGSAYSAFIPVLNERLHLRDRLPGAFNAANVLAALLAVSGLLNIPVKEIAPNVINLKPVRGRMTSVNRGQPFEVVVDYAHTPSSFEAIFPPLRARLDKSGGRIISLFGSAGERDTQKRSEQGKIAGLYSDIIILTDEDPRGESSMDILKEIASGVFSASGGEVHCALCNEVPRRKVFKQSDPSADGEPYAGENLFLIPDRPQAIRKAFSLAKGNDLVILLGKGHENSIIYKDHVMPFDEITETEKALAEIGYIK